MAEDATDWLKSTKKLLSLKNTSKKVYTKRKRGSDIIATSRVEEALALWLV